MRHDKISLFIAFFHQDRSGGEGKISSALLLLFGSHRHQHFCCELMVAQKMTSTSLWQIASSEKMLLQVRVVQQVISTFSRLHSCRFGVVWRGVDAMQLLTRDGKEFHLNSGNSFKNLTLRISEFNKKSTTPRTFDFKLFVFLHHFRTTPTAIPHLISTSKNYAKFHFYNSARARVTKNCINIRF